MSIWRIAAIAGLAGAVAAHAGDPIPAKRSVITEGLDFYGADLTAIFDTTLEACEAACLAQPDCAAFTFNARAGSCFPKRAVEEERAYAGAYSGRVVTAPAGLPDRATQKSGDLSFLGEQDLAAALDQARGLARLHPGAGALPEEMTGAARIARTDGDLGGAIRFLGVALAQTDAADLWAEYATLLLDFRSNDGGAAAEARARAVPAAINAYLRAGSPAQDATALSALARALEANGRGAAMIPALRLAQSRQPRDETAALLDDAIGKYGFRIVEHRVESDSATPRLCASFSEDLIPSGQDYAPFVQLPETGLSVEASGRDICVAGVRHGSRYHLVFRNGIPSASGEVTERNVALDLYVRDRSASVRFPGRAYILPRLEGAGLPVETVNVSTLELTLQKVSDRNLLRAIQDDYFVRPLSAWQRENFGRDIAETVWSGSAEVAMEINRDMTASLPMDEALAGQGPGIYALTAAIPGADPYEKPAPSQWFVISDLGLTTLSGTDGLHVFVRSLASAEALGGVKLTLLSRANAVLDSVETDAQGYARFAEGLTRGQGGAAPALVLAETGAGDMSFLSLTEPEFDLSDRGVEGSEAAPPIDVFLAMDRGAYRAGEVVHLTALARDGAAAALPGLPLTARLMRPDGVEYARALMPEAGAGGHTADMALAGGVPRGTWRVDILADPDAPPLASRAFLVEDFLPERIDVTLGLPDGPLDAAALPDLDLRAGYLFGAPGGDLAVEGEWRLTATDRLPDWPGYRFGRHDQPFDAIADSLSAGIRTDAGGAADLPLTLPEITPDPGRPLMLSVTARVSEGSGRPVERRIDRTLRPLGAMIGIRPDFGEETLGEGSEAGFSVVGLGANGAAEPMPVHWVLNRVETEYQWYSLYGQWNWEPVTRRTRVAEGEIALDGIAPGRVTAPVEWGQYELVVERRGTPYASASVGFDAGWYAPADAAQTPDTLAVSLDRPAYRAGDTAILRIVPRFAGTALVTVVSNRLIAMQAVPVIEGENTVPLPVTADWGAGAYVTATVMRGVEGLTGRDPVRALGLAHAAVDPGDRRLAVSIEAPAESDPRGDLPVALKVEGLAPGETAWATIAAVDQGILNLTGFAPPDPAGHYFGQRRLGIGIRDVYGRLIDGRAGAPGLVRSGGDAGAEMRMQAPPPTEELVAYFSGPLTVGPDGYARTSFALPAFNGSVRLMAVAWSERAVGQADTTVLVRDPVVVQASLPRFLAPGDQSRLLIELTHAFGPAGRVGLDVIAEGAGLDAASVPSGLDLAEHGTARLSIPLTAPDVEGIARIRVALTTPDGRQLSRDLALPVMANDPVVARRSRFTLAAGDTFTFDNDVFAGFRPGTGRATLAVGPVARFDAPGLLEALDRYPYGCTEQITSKALPLLYLSSVSRAMGMDRGADPKERIDQAITAVLTNQGAAGGFGLWQPGSGDLWLDAYVTDFLSRARASGHLVPDPAFRSALDNLRNQVNYASDFDRGGGDLAYALMVLAREGAAALGDLRYYADVKGDAFDTPIGAAQLGAALASYGDQTRADAMFARAGRLWETADAASDEEPLWRADYGTGLRDAAAVLALATGAGSSAIPDARLTEAIAEASAERRLSTQEAVWTLLAANALIDRTGAEGFTVNGAPVTGPVVELLEDTAGAGPLAIANGSGRDETVTLTAYGVPVEPQPPGGNGYAITRRYFTPEGAPMPEAPVAAGARMIAVIEVTPYVGGGARLMVDDPLPAGYEIENPNLLHGGDVAGLDWLDLNATPERAEFRQDRFLAAVDWQGDQPFRLAYRLRAVSPGRFHQPAASVEDMYRPEYRGQSAEGTVEVSP